MPRIKVKEIAEPKGWTAAKLARRADLSYPTVADLWKDPERDVSLRTLEKLARVLEVEIADLIESEQRP